MFFQWNWKVFFFSRSLRPLFFLNCLFSTLGLWGNALLEEIQFGSPKIVLPTLNGMVFEADRISGANLGESGFSWVGQLKGFSGGFVSFAKVKE